MSFSNWSVKETTTGMLKITEIYLGKKEDWMLCLSSMFGHITYNIRMTLMD